MKVERLLIEEVAKHVDPKALFLSSYEAGGTLEVFFERGQELRAFINLLAKHAGDLKDCWVVASLSENSGCLVLVWGEEEQGTLSWVRLL